jgi:hypothetical protein
MISAFARSTLTWKSYLNVNVSRPMTASLLFSTIKPMISDPFNDVDVVLALTDKRGNFKTGKLAIRVPQQSLTQPAAADMSNAVTDIAINISNQQDLAIIFESLLNKFEILDKVGDEVTMVRSLLSSILSH